MQQLQPDSKAHRSRLNTQRNFIIKKIIAHCCHGKYKCHTLGAKLPWLQVVSAIVLDRNPHGFGLRAVRLYRTKDLSQTTKGQRTKPPSYPS